MADTDDLNDEDLFADLYEGDDAPANPQQSAAAVKAEPEPIKAEVAEEAAGDGNTADAYGADNDDANYGGGYNNGDADMGGGAWNGSGGGNHGYESAPAQPDDDYGPINIKEDG
jgi:hypothetical protein